MLTRAHTCETLCPELLATPAASSPDLLYLFRVPPPTVGVGVRGVLGASPSGRATLILSTASRFWTSLWMLWATPGYWEKGRGGEEGRKMGVTPWGGQVSTPLPPCLPSHLDLHGHLCAVPQHALVHLPDGGSCKGHLLQRGHLGLPVPAELLFENSLGRVVMTLIIVVSGSWVRALCWALHVLITPLATCRALGQALGCYPTLRMRKLRLKERPPGPR